MEKLIKLLIILLVSINRGNAQIYMENKNQDLKNDSFKIISDTNKIELISTVDNKNALTINFWDATKISGFIKPINDTIYQSITYSYLNKISSISELKMINDVLVQDGIKYIFHENGRISKLYTYTNGKLNGQYFSYFENGKIEIIGNFDNGEEIGNWSYFNKKGWLIKKKCL